MASELQHCQEELSGDGADAGESNAKVWRCSAEQRLFHPRWPLALVCVTAGLAVVVWLRTWWRETFFALLPQLCWSIGGLSIFLIFVLPAFMVDVAPMDGKCHDADSAAANTGANVAAAQAKPSAAVTATSDALACSSAEDAREERATAATTSKCPKDERASGLSHGGSFLAALTAAVEKPPEMAEVQARGNQATSGTANTEETHRDGRQGGSEVFLNIYDVSHQNKIQHLNSLLSHRLSPLKLGGIFHAGVEVNGHEWSFGNCGFGSGVAAHAPQQHPHHHFRESVRLSCTHLSPGEIARVVKDLKEEYQGSSYKLLGRNCCHFADDMCCRLGVGNIPSWVHRFSRVAECVVSWSDAFEDLLLDTGDEDSCANALRSDAGKIAGM